MSDKPAEDLILGADFPPATHGAWRKLVDGVLKGAPFEKKLLGRSYDGLAMQPLYARAAGSRPVIGRAGAWEVLQRIEMPDADAANAEALHDLANGATGLALVFKGALGDYGSGLDASEEAIARVLDGVYLEAAQIECDISPQTKDAPMRIAALARQRGITPQKVTLRAGFDPLGAVAAAGGSVAPWRGIAPIFARLVCDLAAQGLRGPFAAADGRVVHAAGGSEAQELGFVLAVALAYLRALEAGGVALDQARRLVFFRLAADADQFLTIAKFRALRKLWARVEQACALTPEPAFLSAETAWRMMTRRDPHVNMLRATMAVFAAALGGADGVTVLPFTAALGLPDRFARRVARNTQLILLEESHLAKVADPAAGSGGIEDLTDQLCGAAWALFQEIEKAGGAAGALAAGLIQNKVAAVRAEREKAVARRKDALTGTSEFPNIDEAPASVLAPAPTSPGLRGEVARRSPQGEGVAGAGDSRRARPAESPPHPDPLPASGERGRTAYAALSPIRLAEPFEALRDASDRILAATGARPKVFLANLGMLSDFTARAQFAKSAFEAGGIEAVSNDGFADRDAMVAAFKASGAKLACLCSSDKVYAAEAADAARALAADGAQHIYLAGRPGDLEPVLKAAGVRKFIYAGCDVPATLREAHAMLEQRSTKVTS